MADDRSAWIYTPRGQDLDICGRRDTNPKRKRGNRLWSSLALRASVRTERVEYKKIGHRPLAIDERQHPRPALCRGPGGGVSFLLPVVEKRLCAEEPGKRANQGLSGVFVPPAGVLVSVFTAGISEVPTALVESIFPEVVAGEFWGM